jgi:hypothetical protein
MQVDTPEHPPTSLRGFVQQYAMIVLSILTALALEQLVVSVHNASTARASRVRIESEIARFVADLKVSAQTNRERLKKVNAVLTTLDAKLKDDTIDDATTNASAQQIMDQLGINLPSYQRDAWDTAIADQSLTHLDSDILRHFSEIYADALISSEETRLLLTGDFVRRVSDTKLGFRIGKLDGRELAATLTLDALAGQDILSHQEELIRLIEGDQRGGIERAPVGK